MQMFKLFLRISRLIIKSINNVIIYLIKIVYPGTLEKEGSQKLNSNNVSNGVEKANNIKNISNPGRTSGFGSKNKINVESNDHNSSIQPSVSPQKGKSSVIPLSRPSIFLSSRVSIVRPNQLGQILPSINEKQINSQRLLPGASSLRQSKVLSIEQQHDSHSNKIIPSKPINNLKQLNNTGNTIQQQQTNNQSADNNQNTTNISDQTGKMNHTENNDDKDSTNYRLVYILRNRRVIAEQGDPALQINKDYKGIYIPQEIGFVTYTACSNIRAQSSSPLRNRLLQKYKKPVGGLDSPNKKRNCEVSPGRQTKFQIQDENNNRSLEVSLLGKSNSINWSDQLHS